MDPVPPPPEAKPITSSKTIWGIVITIIGIVLQAVGILPPGVGDLISHGVEAAGLGLAVHGRITAQGPLTILK